MKTEDPNTQLEQTVEQKRLAKLERRSEDLLPSNEYSPLEVAIAISLYTYNVSPAERALKLHQHFSGQCAELEDLVRILVDVPAFFATEFAVPTAFVYVKHALLRYGLEAKNRVAAETHMGELGDSPHA